MIPWYLFAFGAAAAIVIRDLANKRALHAEHALEMLVAQAFFFTPLLIILGFFIPTRLPAGTVAIIYLVSLVGTVGILLRVRGLRHLDVGHAAPLENVNPLFLLLIAGIFIGERLTAAQLAGVLLVVAGTYILQGSEEYPGILGPVRHLARDRFAWITILAAFVLSISQTFDKHLISAGIDPFTYLFWIWLFINLNFLVLHLLRYRWHGLRVDLVRDWRWLGLAAAALFAQMVCYYLAVAEGPITLILPINRLSALGLILVGGKLFHEHGLGRRAVAVGLMITGTLCMLL